MATFNTGGIVNCTLPESSFSFHLTTATDGTEVRSELKAIEATKRAKRIKKIAKAHGRAWYANANNGDVAVFHLSEGVYGVAVARELNDGEIRWVIGGKDGTHTFPDFVKYLVDRKVYAVDVEYR